MTYFFRVGIILLQGVLLMHMAKWAEIKKYQKRYGMGVRDANSDSVQPHTSLMPQL